MPDRNVYDVAMRLKAIELPPAVAKAFARDMRPFFAGKNAIKRDEIDAGSSRKASRSAWRSAAPILHSNNRPSGTFLQRLLLELRRENRELRPRQASELAHNCCPPIARMMRSRRVEPWRNNRRSRH
jgi:hypothetical protein